MLVCVADSRLVGAGKIVDRTVEMFSSLPSDGVSGLGANPHYLTKCEDDTHILLLTAFPMLTAFAFQWLECGGDIFVGSIFVPLASFIVVHVIVRVSSRATLAFRRQRSM